MFFAVSYVWTLGEHVLDGSLSFSGARLCDVLDLLDTLILPFFGPLHTLIECCTLGAASSLCLHHVCFELPSLYPTTCDLVVVLRLVWRKAWWLNHIAVLWMAYCFVSLQMGWCMFSFFVVLLGSCSIEQIGNGSFARYSCHRSCVHFCVTMGVHFQLPCPLIGEAHQARTVGKFTQRRFNQARATERPIIWNGKHLDLILVLLEMDIILMKYFMYFLILEKKEQIQFVLFLKHLKVEELQLQKTEDFGIIEYLLVKI